MKKVEGKKYRKKEQKPFGLVPYNHIRFQFLYEAPLLHGLEMNQV